MAPVEPQAHRTRRLSLGAASGDVKGTGRVQNICERTIFVATARRTPCKWKRSQLTAMLFSASLTKRNPFDKPKLVDFVLDVDQIVAESRIRLYLLLEYSTLFPKEVSKIVTMDANFHPLLPALNRQKQELSFAEWNAYRVANGRSPLDPVYLQYMCGREGAVWKLVDQMAKAFTKP